jgi:hypothetical protein
MTMSANPTSVPANSEARTNGSGAAAVLAAGIGSFMVGLLAVAADQFASLKSLFVFYKPTGPLSGVTTSAILVWLIAWAILDWRWQKRTVALARINAAAFVLLGLSLLLTFPPIADLF